MNETEAARCLAPMLVFDRREWTGPQIEAWTQAIRKCTDVQAAMSASESLVNETEPRDWSLHRWRQAYQDYLRRATPALPAQREGPTISLAQMLELTAARAARGDTEAAEIHDNLKKARDGKILGGTGIPWGTP